MVYDITGNPLYSEAITPEQFGAIGDGSTDDTTAIQAALSASATQNKPVALGSGKTYAISNTLTITKRQDIYGNGAVIKAITALTDVVRINTETSHFPISIGKGLITNLTIDANGLANNGIYVQYSAGYQIQNVDIGKVLQHGIYIAAGFEIFCNNVRVSSGVLDLESPIYANVIGIYVNTSDCHFSNIVTVNVKTAIVVKKSLNMFDFIHCWNTWASIMPTTTMFDTYESIIATNCYCDCCTTAVKIHGNVPAYFYGFYHLNYTRFMPASVMGSVVPEFFNLDSSANPSRIKGYGIVVSGNVTTKFSNKEASVWTDFDWINNNDTSLNNLTNHPTN